VAKLWWQDIASFAQDLRPASDDRLREMYEWARQREVECDRPGRGRNAGIQSQWTATTSRDSALRDSTAIGPRNVKRDSVA
jgi:hypothetical protein